MNPTLAYATLDRARRNLEELARDLRPYAPAIAIGISAIARRVELKADSFKREAFR